LQDAISGPRKDHSVLAILPSFRDPYFWTNTTFPDFALHPEWQTADIVPTRISISATKLHVPHDTALRLNFCLWPLWTIFIL
jgi:hypothetical protein